ncbi:K(+)/H(+) antiporter 1 [Viridothelium virens]|uniref:K(+)/H(+) antiporter 1 n=1 Tax=Viridothelium virens TaxID=1048519 RepID=A0A6A6GUX9_VIRVR|nr:K(+)/H(+) antiporter 1 [Viridothelium virens]
MATTVTHSFTKTVSVTSSTASSTSRAKAQGGILEGGNPSVYDPTNPIIIFIIQAGIILIFCRLLHYPLSRIRQPRVIAEVIGGVLLGPSVMGRIPGFTNAIFPAAAMPNLTLVANLGLVLFLFLVGLEVDLRFLGSNWRVALTVSAASMVLPFGLGCAIAWGLYNEFRHEPGLVPISFGTYMLFIGIAMAITAFPVLCRILTELKLLSTPVGVITLAAGVGNDVVGWILLALCVALVNAGSGITALWVLLTCVGYALFLYFAVRPGLMWILRRTHSIENGPSQSIVALTLLIAITSAFFTGVIGVHPIFGAFMAGLICPHEGGFAIKVTEKVEDLVSTLFLPLYFALSGLSTNLGLLNNGITWAYVVGVIAIAFLAKFSGASISARLNGLMWRESFSIGALMSCKGLVELIVLNIGLQAKILSQRTFTIFVVMALVTTFATTPLTSALYPSWYQKKLEAWKRGEIDWDTGNLIDSTDHEDGVDPIAAEKAGSGSVRRLLVYLRLDNMPSLIAFMSLMGSTGSSAPKTHPSKQSSIEVHGVRMVELTDRDSSVMQVSEIDEFSAHDPLVNTLRTFGQMHNLAASGEVAIVPESGYADMLVTKAADADSNMILLPWSETGSMSETQTISSDSVRNKLASSTYIQFVSTVLNNARCSTAVFVNRGFGGNSVLRERSRILSRTTSSFSIHSANARDQVRPLTDRTHHIFMPFFGGADDKKALRLVLQLAQNSDVTATIIHYETNEERERLLTSGHEQKTGHDKSATVNVTGNLTTDDAVFFSSVTTSLPAGLDSRVLVESCQVEDRVSAAIERAKQEISQNPRNAGDLVVVGRSATRLSTDAGGSKKCLGAFAEVVLASGLRTSVLAVQAAPES